MSCRGAWWFIPPSNLGRTSGERPRARCCSVSSWLIHEHFALNSGVLLSVIFASAFHVRFKRMSFVWAIQTSIPIAELSDFQETLNAYEELYITIAVVETLHILLIWTFTFTVSLHWLPYRLSSSSYGSRFRYFYSQKNYRVKKPKPCPKSSILDCTSLPHNPRSGSQNWRSPK
jgi:hypothetical protein